MLLLNKAFAGTDVYYSCNSTDVYLTDGESRTDGERTHQEVYVVIQVYKQWFRHSQENKMRAVPTWVDKVHDRDRNEQVSQSILVGGRLHILH